MKIYDTLLLGAGYGAVGYAEARGNCLIIEEGQVADTQFYLPMRGFVAGEMSPKTAAGERLYSCIAGMGLIRSDALCVNGLECAFARYILDNKVEMLLKCRMVRCELCGDVYDVTLQTNAGLSHVRACRILDTRPRGGEKQLTVLVNLRCEPDEAIPALLSAFPGATLAPAFYPGRYAMTIPAEGYDENTVKQMVWERFPRITGMQILYIAPAVIAAGCENRFSDAVYPDPVAAYEAGASFFGGEC